MKNISNIVTGAAGAVDKALAEGAHVGGERYVIFRVEDRSMYGRQVCLNPLSPSILIKNAPRSTVS